MIFQNLSDNKDIIFQSDNGSGGITTYLELDGSQTTVNLIQITVLEIYSLEQQLMKNLVEGSVIIPSGQTTQDISSYSNTSQSWYCYQMITFKSRNV